MCVCGGEFVSERMCLRPGAAEQALVDNLREALGNIIVHGSYWNHLWGVRGVGPMLKNCFLGCWKADAERQVLTVIFQIEILERLIEQSC